MAIRRRGSSPIDGRPTRRITFSCSGDESGISEKSILRVVRRALATARPPRTDETDRFRIATSPQRVGDHEHTPVVRFSEPPKTWFAALVFQVRTVLRYRTTPPSLDKRRLDALVEEATSTRAAIPNSAWVF
jgi:hypothetical protein